MKEERKGKKKTEKASWIKMKPAEIEKITKELAEKGNTPAKIGLILRDKYGIPKTKIFGKKITRILKETKIKYITEKEIADKKIEKLRIHKAKHKYDHTASRSLAKKLWFSHNLAKKM